MTPTEPCTMSVLDTGLNLSGSSMRTLPCLLVNGLLALAVALGTGCDRSGDRAETSPENGGDSTSTSKVDHLEQARRNLMLRQFDQAADAAYKALVQDPENADAILVAAEAEAGRNNHQVAADLAGSIDLGSRLGRRAVELQVEQLVKLDQTSAAADRLIEAIEVIYDVPRWRHDAWQMLNRLGRREEASHQAEALCRMGQASEQHLHSLVRRNRSFPFKLADGEDPARYFTPGLGMARWYFSHGEMDKALHELFPESQTQFDSPASCALYGRLLAETQAFESIPDWHASCDESVKKLGDYWAALGVYFYDQREYEASGRALLEAVLRNPTDRISLQRLFKVFNSLGDPNVGQAYRDRGIDVADTERLSDAILDSDDQSLKLELMKKLAGLGRPFETLQWTLLVVPAGSPEQMQVAQQRDQLARSEKALRMAAESSLLDQEIEDFQIGDAMKTLQSGQSPDRVAAADASILATPKLTDVAKNVGIEFQWVRGLKFDDSIIPIHESVGGGIAVIDFDLDGWPDVYLAQGAGEPPSDKCTQSSVLIRNIAGRFVDVTAAASVTDFNYSSGLAAGDVNQDGFLDLYLGSLGHNRLLINNGDGTFKDVTDRLGEFDDRFTSSLAIADINGDSLPDLFETNYIAMDGGFVIPKTDEEGKPVMPGPLSHYSGRDRWFENLGDGGFQLHEVPIEDAFPGTSLGIVVTDFDADGKNDVFVGNDVRPNHLLVQSEKNQFVNLADSRGVANGYSGIPNGCMGIAAADYNRDGLIDLHITNFNNESDNLFVQTPGGIFSDIAIRYGIDQATSPMVGFGTKSVDLDRNGWLDLLMTNGHIFDTRIFGEPFFEMPPQLMMSKGRQFELSEVEDNSGYWDGNYLGRAMATLDYDRNGTIDFLISHLDHPLTLLDNQTLTDGAWLQLELIGTATERDAIGTRVVVTATGQSFTHWVTAGDGYFCTDQPVLDFGLGTESSIESVEIHWPGGAVQTLEELRPNQRYLVVEGTEEAWESLP